MKLVKLSLVAALAAGAFSVANATPLDEAIKDIDVSGALRYRYNTGKLSGLARQGIQDLRSSVGGSQDHNWRAQVNFDAAIADNFKAFIQFDYNATDRGYRTQDPITGQFVRGGVSNTDTEFNVRQYYLTYTNEDVATSVLFGKQQLNTIWTDNGIDGLVGTGLKVVNTSVDGLTLAAFAVDNFNAKLGDNNGGTESDTVLSSGVFAPGNFNPYANNLYGIAGIGAYEVLGGDLNSQLWLSYLDNTAFFYALDVAYSTELFGLNYKGEFAYLGNAVESDFEEMTFSATRTDDIRFPAVITTPLGGANTPAVDNGNFFALKGSIEWNGFDAALGGVYYGDKEKFTITTLEDMGNIDHLFAGKELKYTDGSNLSGDYGENTFGYLTLGYTFNETIRTGVDFVYGGTETAGALAGTGGEKFEVAPSISYQYSPKLNFQAWYSYVSVEADRDAGQPKAEGEKNTVRLQALYKF